MPEREGEDLVHMLWAMGHDGGVDVDKLLAAARKLPDIVGDDVPGQVVKVGRCNELHALAGARRGGGIG